MRLEFSALEIPGRLLSRARADREPVVIFQAGAYTVVNTGTSTNSSQVGWTLIGPGLWKTLCVRESVSATFLCLRHRPLRI